MQNGFRKPSVPANKKFAPADRKRQAKRRSAEFARLKEAWAHQVASDRGLSQTALRTALVVPIWLNSKTLTFWPSQKTLAAAIRGSDRAVRGALKSLEARGHLQCVSLYRGGRRSNVYRIVVEQVVLNALQESEEPSWDNEYEEELRSKPAKQCRSDRNRSAGEPGKRLPVRPEEGFRGTPEKTIEKTCKGEGAGNSDSQAQEDAEERKPVSAETAASIMAEAFGASNVANNGFLHRKGE